MTTKPAAQPHTAGVSHRLTYLPDPPRYIDAMPRAPHIHRTYMVLEHHFRFQPDVLVGSGGYLCYDARNVSRSPYPDCMVAFGLAVPPGEIVEANGYTISEVGKPPEFVLEVASSSMGPQDYIVKRKIYASYGVQEYWRFDYTGGRYHATALAGDRLVNGQNGENGQYEPIPMATETDGILRGYSAMLDLELRIRNGELRFWDPKTGEYLLNLTEVKDQITKMEAQIMEIKAQTELINAQRDTAAAQRDAAATERDAMAAARDTVYANRDAALERIRQLEAELRRRQSES